jgi:hypothetical protein
MKRLAVLFLSAAFTVPASASDPSRYQTGLTDPSVKPAEAGPLLSNGYLRSIITTVVRPDVALADRTIGEYLRVRRIVRQLEAMLKEDAQRGPVRVIRP